MVLIVQGSAPATSERRPSYPSMPRIIGIVDRCRRRWTRRSSRRDQTRSEPHGSSPSTKTRRSQRRRAGRLATDASRNGRAGVRRDMPPARPAFTQRRRRGRAPPTDAFEAFAQVVHRRAQPGDRVHPPTSASSKSRRSGKMEMDETKIGRLDHKIEKLIIAGEKTPGVEFLRIDAFQRRPRLDGRRVRSVRRHRRHHAGDALAADAGQQRDQHARCRQRGRLQPASERGQRRQARRASSSTRRSARRSASTT